MTAMPALRFKRDDGSDYPDCEEKRLGDVLYERKESAPKSSGLPHISLTTEGVVPKTARYDRDFLVRDDEEKKYKITRLGDLCYNPANLKFGVISMNKLGDGIFSPIYVTFEIRDAIPEYIEALVKQPDFQKKIRRYEQGTVYERMAVSAADFVTAKIAFPHPDEQKKIAAFLGAVDNKINALRRKHDGLKQFKAGLMQKLFSQELRFKRDDGSNYPDWEEKRLGELFVWVRTNNLSRDALTSEPFAVQNIHYGDIHSKFRASFHQTREDVPYVDERKWSKPFSDEEFCRVGDVVIADASEDYADIGKAIEIIEVKKGTLVAGLHTYIARQINNQLVTGFSGYLLRSGPMRRQIMRIAQGISVLGISKTNLSKLELDVPHPDEQQKIADCLSAVDAKIEAVDGQITQMEAFKKGLLQKMFV
jgi:type I restriction enzyme, S subunit